MSCMTGQGRTSTCAGWYVVQCKPGREVTASVELADQGFRVFRPLRLVEISHARKREHVERGLFPRYLFVSTEHCGLSWGAIDNTRGVANRGVLRWQPGEESLPVPYVVRDKIIEDIRRRCDLAKAKTGELRTGYQPGETFIVPVGPFSSFSATYLGEERGRVSAIVHIFGRATPCSLSFSDMPKKPEFDKFPD